MFEMQMSWQLRYITCVSDFSHASGLFSFLSSDFFLSYPLSPAKCTVCAPFEYQVRTVFGGSDVRLTDLGDACISDSLSQVPHRVRPSLVAYRRFFCEWTHRASGIRM